ncbi:MAG: hypothetical protein MJZ98_02105 [Paludibacteraceae bacterium]|nr:hypothetical protein [Paludibacteraceae bacterium]
MTYRFTVKSDENDQFLREIRIDSAATFIQLNDAILDSVKFTHDEITSFFTVTDRDEDREMWAQWNKEQEITVMDMGLSSDRDSYIMDKTYLDEFIHEEHQRLLFVFDQMTERAFYVELEEIIIGEDVDKPVCTRKRGDAPKQQVDFDTMTANITTDSSIFDDDNLYGSDGYNEDELSEGYEIPMQEE